MHRLKVSTEKAVHLSTRSPAGIAKIRSLTRPQRQISARIKTWPTASRTGINPRLRRIHNAQARQRSRFHDNSRIHRYVIVWRCSAHQSYFAPRNWRENATAIDQN